MTEVTAIEGAYWSGQPVEARRFRAVIADTDEFPRYWAREQGIVGREAWVIEVQIPSQETLTKEPGVAKYIDEETGKERRRKAMKTVVHTTPPRVMYLWDEDGSGMEKVTRQRGSSLVGHRTVAIEAAPE